MTRLEFFKLTFKIENQNKCDIHSFSHLFIQQMFTIYPVPDFILGPGDTPGYQTVKILIFRELIVS